MMINMNQIRELPIFERLYRLFYESIVEQQLF